MALFKMEDLKTKLQTFTRHVQFAKLNTLSLPS